MYYYDLQESKMSHPSQVCMSELQSFMTPQFILNAFQKLGHHPISATMTKKRKGDDKDICIVQFANEDAAKQAVFKLNGKLIPSSNYAQTTAKFKLSQCIGNRIAEYNVWVGDLTVDVDDYHFFKFFSNNYKSLYNAKVICDTRTANVISKGYGFLRFSDEEEQKHCLKNMGGSLGLGGRPIKVGPVVKGHGFNHGSNGNEPANGDERLTEQTKVAEDDPWVIYNNWNKFEDVSEFHFVATKLRSSSAKEDTETQQDLRLIDYNFNKNTDEINKELLERDCYLWDALECTKWLPTATLSTVSFGKAKKA